MRIERSVNTRLGRLSLLTAAMAAPLLWAAPATAAPAAPSSPTGSYLLTVEPEKGLGVARSATLTCAPDGGTHTTAATACDQLRRARGKVAAIPEDPGPCTKEYAPVRVTAVGTWKGQQRRYTQTYSNHCMAVRATGGVLFAF
ncbi:protease inhibitor protein [Planomonospora sp. ID67723]|uniref:SSI family serine proteinase inhibitor n=1 Tax=Planomonospora sp. ID67723 TaxID=2738134 RepID=UPI0018C38EDC|nr:SSI family serine proteinase inhibitor [Planomonospora sp. ID67723]MBG0831354.1 protease inhibitor protein [Planomonospora sp. ID67723]